MKKIIFILVLVLSLMISACEFIQDPIFNRYDITSSPIIGGLPPIMDSATDGTYNYYLIDGGYIQNVPLSSGSIITYNGQTPITVSFTKTTVSETTVEQALSKTISESVSKTHMNEAGGKIGVEADSIVGIWGAKINVEGHYSRTWGTITEKTNSTTSTFSTANSFSESLSESITFTVGNAGELPGDYRLSLIATCDIYFIITTNHNNTILVDSTAVICARSNPQPRFALEYDVIGGDFGKTDISQEINFPANFYRSLPIPEKHTTTPLTPPLPPVPPSFSFLNPYSTGFKTVRTETIRVTDSGRFNQPFDVVNFNTFDVNLNTMIQEGFKTISFFIRLNVREIDDGYQYLFLFNSPDQSNNFYIAERRFEHSPGRKDTTWWVHYEDELYFVNIPIERFTNNQFVIRYGASGTNADTWENNNLQIQLLFRK